MGDHVMRTPLQLIVAFDSADASIICSLKPLFRISGSSTFLAVMILTSAGGSVEQMLHVQIYHI